MISKCLKIKVVRPQDCEYEIIDLHQDPEYRKENFKEVEEPVYEKYHNLSLSYINSGIKPRLKK